MQDVQYIILKCTSNQLILKPPLHQPCPCKTLYSYDAEYLDENGVRLEIPANIPPETAALVQDLAIKTFKTLSGEGLCRIGFFLRPDDMHYQWDQHMEGGRFPHLFQHITAVVFRLPYVRTTLRVTSPIRGLNAVRWSLPSKPKACGAKSGNQTRAAGLIQTPAGGSFAPKHDVFLRIKANVWSAN